MTLKLDFTVDRGSFILQAKLELPAHGVTALFGRSGSGKTTLLRCIAGLKRQKGGYMSFRGETWQEGRHNLPTWKRPIGYVFQEASLFPHLRVAQNLDYGYRRVAVANRRLHPDEVIYLLGLESLLERYPEQLSGGQRQRVSLGRALLTSPELLLMDEPLASLDAVSKEEILPFFERLRDELGIPIIYVSHSIDEVIRLADHMVLIDEGKVIAQGELRELLVNRELPFVRTENASAVLHGRVLRPDAGDALMQLDVDGQALLMGQHPVATGQAVRIKIMARDVGLALQPPHDTSFLNCLPVSLLDIQPGVQPSQLLARLSLGDQILLSRLSVRSAENLRLRPGQALYALIKGVALG